MVSTVVANIKGNENENARVLLVHSFHDCMFCVQQHLILSWHYMYIFIIVNGSCIFRSTKILQSWLSSKDKSKYWRWEMVAGVITGFSTSLISISFVMLLQQIKSSLPGLTTVRSVLQSFFRVPFSRACFLAVYLFVVGWLAFQYWKRLGLLDIFTAFYN